MWLFLTEEKEWDLDKLYEQHPLPMQRVADPGSMIAAPWQGSLYRAQVRDEERWGF